LSHIAVSMQCEEIASHAAPGDRRIQAPQSLASLRQVGRDRPVLQELCPVVEDAAEPAFVDQLPEERDGGNAAVVVPDRVRHPGALDGADHRFRLRGGASERLLAGHHLPGASGGDGDLGMRIVGTGNVDQVDVLAFDEAPPIRFRGLVAPIGGEPIDTLAGARRHRLDHRFEREVEVTRRLQ
jgi:hypothetical protein